MNPEIVSSDPSTDTTDTGENTLALEGNNTETKLLPPKASSTQSSNTQWQEYGEGVATFIQDLPTYVTRFYEQNKGLLGTLGLIVLAVVTVRVTLALVDAINGIPFIAPTFELIGIAYTGWFVYRYLLRAENRRELGEEFKTLKAQVFGTED